jgi:hypothetical protein
MVINPSTDARGLPELTTWRRISDPTASAAFSITLFE